MLKIIFLFLWFLGNAFAVNPFYQLSLKNNIIDMNYIDNRLFVATDFGEVVEINFDSKFQNISQKTLIELPHISNFFGDSYPPKVFSVDFFDQRFLIDSEGSDGKKNLFIFEEKLEKLPLVLNVKKAAFVDKDRIFLGLMSNEIVLYDLKDKKVIYQKQLSEATFSDFILSRDRTKFLVSCESGILYYGEVLSGEVLEELSGINKDNVYEAKMASTSNGLVVITAGQDRKAGVYLKNSQSYAKEAEFLVYSVGLSASGEFGAYMKNEMSDIVVFKISSKEEVAILQGHNSLLNSIIFVDDKRIISAEDEKNILFWKLP